MNLKMRDKICGSIYGFAIGDAMGATTEFMTPSQIRRRYGVVKDIIGGGWLNLKPGEVTDDTQMTICIIDAIMQKPKDINELINRCKENFVDWYYTGPKDIGNQCSKGIHAIINNQELSEDENALGNGSLMRAMPFAILNLPACNVLQGKITHNNKLCSNIILEYTELLQSYLNNNYNNLYTYKYKYLLEPSGNILNTFNNSALWSCKDSFEDAILGAVNHGGDADTIAAITGSLAGAKFGYSKIPKRWIEKLNPAIRTYLNQFIKYVYRCLSI